MASSIASSNSGQIYFISNPHPDGWAKSQVTDWRVRQLFLQKAVEIFSSYHHRNQSRSLEALGHGFWHADAYAEALQEKKQLDRLSILISKGAFYHGCPPEGFFKEPKKQSSSSLTQFEGFCYRLKSDCLPTEGLRNIHSGRVSFLDCGQACELATYETLREILGDERFNTIFSASGNTPLQFMREKSPTLEALELMTCDTLQPLEQPQLGDVVYFDNLPWYGAKHPHGETFGLNTICMGGDRFVGMDTTPEGQTEEELVDLMVAECNKTPIKTASLFSGKIAEELSAATLKCRLAWQKKLVTELFDFQTTREGFYQDFQKEGSQPMNSLVFYLNTAKIQELLS